MVFGCSLKSNGRIRLTKCHGRIHLLIEYFQHQYTEKKIIRKECSAAFTDNIKEMISFMYWHFQLSFAIRKLTFVLDFPT